jgi:superfamily I DNA/RNA helicase
VGEIADGMLRVGKITLTTYHSAKGREWDTVILPGLIDGILPKRKRASWQRAFGAPTQLGQDRRAFYVGVTRAKDTVVLIYPDDRAAGSPEPSRFVRDILQSQNSAGAPNG